MKTLSLAHSPPARWAARHRDQLLRAIVVVGVLSASVVVAPRASPTHLLLLGGGAIALVFLQRPEWGLRALVGATFLVPFAIGTGTQTSLNVTVLLLGLLFGLWLLRMAGRQHVALLDSPPIRPLLLFIVVALVAFISGSQSWLIFAHTAPLRAQVGGLAIFVLSAAAFLLVSHQVTSERGLRRLTWLFLTVAGFFILSWMVPPIGDRVSFLFQHGADGSLFWVWVGALAFGQAAFNRDLRLAPRLLLAALVASSIVLTFIQNRAWVSGWLPALIALGATLVAGAPRLGIPASAAGAIALLIEKQAVLAGVLIGDNQYSLDTRLEAWRIILEIVKVNPILGLGPANYYWYTPLFPILGYSVSFNSHNNYVDIIAQTGLLGLALLLWFFWRVGRLGWQLRTRAASGFAHGYVCGALGGLAGTLAAAMLGDWVLPFVYNVGITGFRASVLAWLFLGGLVVLEQRAIPAPAAAVTDG